MKTKKAFIWNRIEVPAGSPVDKINGEYFVNPKVFNAGSIERHDALHYGCRVDKDNVE